MTAGMITRLVRLDPSTLSNLPPLTMSLELDITLLAAFGTSVAVLLLSQRISKYIPQTYRNTATNISSLVIGLLFGYGLYKGGMTDTRRVLGFLMLPSLILPSHLAASHRFDPSLMFIMIGGCLSILMFCRDAAKYLPVSGNQEMRRETASL